MTKIKSYNLITGCFCALGCETIFGLSYIFTKTGTEAASAFALLGWRFFIAIVILSICVLLGFVKIELKGKLLKPLFIVALLNPFIYFIGETIGISNTTASESGVFLACIPVVSLVASTFILKRKPAKIQIIGILITLIGVMITVFAVGASSSLSIIGYVFLFMAVISYALYSVFVEKATDYTGIEITYIMILIGTIVFGTLAICEALIQGNLVELVILPFKESSFAIAVLYQGIGSSIIAFFLSNVAISKIGVNRTSSFIGVATVVSIIAGAVLLKETFTIYQIIGAVVIIIGVYTANVKKDID